MMKKASLPPMQMRAAFSPNTVDQEKRTIEIKWASLDGNKVLRSPFFGEPYFEELSMDPAHIRMKRMDSGRMPFLSVHDRRKLENVLGTITRGWVDSNEGFAEVRFSQREDVEPIWNDVRDGILPNVSVGYKVYKYQELPRAEGEQYPTYRAVDWEPIEISLVPIGADYDASTRSADEMVQCELVNNCIAEGGEKERGMEKEKQPASEAKTPTVDVEKERQEARQEATRAERQRVSEIQRNCQALKLSDEFARKLVNDGVELEEARKLIIDEAARTQEKSQGATASQVRIEAGDQDEKLTMRSGVENAILLRGGIEKTPSELGRRFVGLSMIEMARKLTGMESGTKSEVASRAMSSSDFPLILGNVAEKMLMRAYQTVGKTYQPIVTPGILTDYKPAKRYQVGDAPDLEEVAEGGEYKYGSFGEKAESIQLADYGRIIKFTRQMMINDDLQAFQRLINNFGSSGGRKEAALVYAVFNSNPTMGDGKALFHSDHGNIETAAAPSVDSLGLMEQLIMEQMTLDETDFLGIVPKFVICGTANKVLIQQLLSSTLVPGSSSDVNPYAGALTPIVDPRISGTKWFLVADPAVIDTIEVAHLEGESGPVIDSKEGWNSDGLEVKCRHTVAVKALEWKGLAYNPGA